MGRQAFLMSGFEKQRGLHLREPKKTDITIEELTYKLTQSPSAEAAGKMFLGHVREIH